MAKPTMADIIHFLVQEGEGDWIRNGQIRLTTLKRLALHCFWDTDVVDDGVHVQKRRQIKWVFDRLTRKLRKRKLVATACSTSLCQRTTRKIRKRVSMEKPVHIPLYHLPSYIRHPVIGSNTLGSDDIHAIEVLFTPSHSIVAVDHWLLAVDSTSSVLINLLLEHNGFRVI